MTEDSVEEQGSGKAGVGGGSTVRRPALRYHGGKWRLAPWIIGHFWPHRVYVEPFGGGASVLLRKERSAREVYNDLDEDVVTLFRVLRDPAAAERLIRLVELTPFARTEFEDAYEPTDDDVERARRLIVRSFMGFGSSVFANHATGFRDYTRAHSRNRYPCGNWANYPQALARCVERFRGVVVDRRDALEVIGRHDSPATLFYADPPYVLETRGSNRGVRQKYAVEIDDDYHRRLAQVLRSVEGQVVISGYACPLYDVELYPDWRRTERRTCADGAVARTEVIWTNRAPEVPSLFAAALTSPTHSPQSRTPTTQHGGRDA